MNVFSDSQKDITKQSVTMICNIINKINQLFNCSLIVHQEHRFYVIQNKTEIIIKMVIAVVNFFTSHTSVYTAFQRGGFSMWWYTYQVFTGLVMGVCLTGLPSVWIKYDCLWTGTKNTEYSSITHWLSTLILFTALSPYMNKLNVKLQGMGRPMTITLSYHYSIWKQLEVYQWDWLAHWSIFLSQINIRIILKFLTTQGYQIWKHPEASPGQSEDSVVSTYCSKTWRWLCVALMK